MDEQKPNVIRPQEGPQEQFLATSADIAIYGGAAGGGKSWAILAECTRHIQNGSFGAQVFRRTTGQIFNEGALWDESGDIYRPLGGKPRKDIGRGTWTFPSGAKITFGHLQYDKTVFNYQGSQIPLIVFDELTHFSKKQFWYMVSRNRSMCGVKPYIRATTNPDADSWVCEFIDWWIDDKGFPIPERSGVVRWFIRVGDRIVWADSSDELSEHKDANGVSIPPKSATFIAAKLTDNKKLLEADPAYMANLMSLPTVERERLLGGNWKIRPAAGLYFQRSWCPVVDAAPAGMRIARGWDFAATEKNETNDPDWTSGTKIGELDGHYYILDNRKGRLSPSKVKTMYLNTAAEDGKSVNVYIPEDPGAAGKVVAQEQIKWLVGFTVRANRASGDKITRFTPFSAQAEAGNVSVVRGGWNESWFSALEGFPEASHDDDVDSTSEAFNGLITGSRYNLNNL